MVYFEKKKKEGKKKNDEKWKNERKRLKMVTLLFFSLFILIKIVVLLLFSFTIIFEVKQSHASCIFLQLCKEGLGEPLAAIWRGWLSCFRARGLV